MENYQLGKFPQVKELVHIKLSSPMIKQVCQNVD